MVLPTAVSGARWRCFPPRERSTPDSPLGRESLPQARDDRRIRGLIEAVLGRGETEPITTTALDAVCCSVCARSSTDRASDYDRCSIYGVLTCELSDHRSTVCAESDA